MLFRIDLDRAPQRILRVALTVELDAAAASEEAEFFLPVWTPGSYLVREFARHVGSFAARDADTGRPLRHRKSAKNRYAVALESGAARRVQISYEVYAHELTVRTACVTDQWAYWNGACVLLWPVGMEDHPASVEVDVPDGWRMVTGRGDPEHSGEGVWRFVCRDLDEAIDTPCLAGPVEEFEFDVGERRHRLCAVGLDGVSPPDSFVEDLDRTVRAAGAVFGGELPFDEYVFLGLFAGSGRGGLEHASSSTLLASRTTFLPESAYEDFLALVAHEYLHVWNVKRMRPEEFWAFDYERENHTELLWVVEGVTTYYDDLCVRRAGISSARRYLDVLGRHVRSMSAMPGRFAQTLCEASFDAWIRFYRPDENTRNSTQNYYANGALLAFVLDAEIRGSTGGARSLDDALRSLWAATYERGRGYAHVDVVDALRTAADRDLGDLLEGLVRGPFEPDLDRALSLFGLELRFSTGVAWIGIQLKVGTTQIATVQRDAPAWRAGLCPGDEILGVGGLRADSVGWRSLWELTARIDSPLDLIVTRQGRILSLQVTPEASVDGQARIVPIDRPTEAQLAHREAWLGARDLPP